MMNASSTIRGRTVRVPPGAVLVNQDEACFTAPAATSPECQGANKILYRGETLIIFDPDPPRILARKILPEDEADFRPIVNIISGLDEGVASPTP
jgi:hypothetical protein